MRLLKTVAFATIVHFCASLSGCMCAQASRTVFEKNGWPDIKVVRKVDYNHYVEERVSHTLEAVGMLAICWMGGYLSLKSLPKSKTMILALFLSGWLQVFNQEAILQMVGARKMDLMQFAERAPTILSKGFDVLNVMGAPENLIKALAIVWQTFLEGGLYFVKPFIVMTMWRGGGRILPLLCATYVCSMRLVVSLMYGWPQPIVIGTEDVVGKRLMLSTLPFRIPQIMAMFGLIFVTRYRKIWLPMAIYQAITLGYYFFLIRSLGRSYVEYIPTTGAEAEEMPIAADLFFTALRVTEPLLGNACALFVAFKGLEILQGPNAIAIPEKKND